MGGRITPAALSQIEAGKTRPSPETVAALAVALGVPPGFFAAPWPTPAGTTPLTYFRDLRATSARERRRAGALAMLLHDVLTAVESYVRLPELDVPVHAVSVNATRSDIEGVADALRRAWGLGTDPIPHVVRLLERHGVAVARAVLGHRLVDGFSVRFSPRPVVLLSDDKANYVRSRFDAAHELGHLVMHGDAEPASRTIETQAQDFAAAFLLPRAVAESELPRRIDASGWSRLAQMKRQWGISMAALLYRGRALGMLSLDTHRNAMKYMSAQGWRTVEPGDREMGPPEGPLLLERALRTAEIESGQKVSDILRDAQLPEADALELITAAIDHRPVIEL